MQFLNGVLLNSLSWVMGFNVPGWELIFFLFATEMAIWNKMQL